MLIDRVIPTHQPPKIENEPVGVVGIETDLNTDYEENGLYQEGIIDEVYGRPGKKNLQ